MMTRAQRIKQAMQEFFADDEAPSTISREDTILKNVGTGGLFPTCPTCSRVLIPGFMNPSMVQCPACQTDVYLAKGEYNYTTKAPNMSRGSYA